MATRNRSGGLIENPLGAWLTTDGFHIAIAPQWLAGIPLLFAILVAMMLVFGWSMVTRKGQLRIPSRSGLGLGLAIVQNLLHSGRITQSLGECRGATFNA
jgi:hypothetical protein